MNVKTYQTKSLQEALDNIKRDLGSEALILSTREVLPARGFGFLRKPKWEVAAAAPRPAVTQGTAAAVAKTQDAPNGKQAKTRSTQVVKEIASKPIPKAEPLNLEVEIARRNASPDRRIDLLLEEMDDLKKSVRSLGRAIPSKSDSESGLYGELVSRGIDADLADRLIAKASETDPSPGEIRNVVRRLLADMLVIEPPAELQAKSRIVSVFVGPTGVGKTTTIAKIAGQAAAKHHKKVALITTDLLRVGSQDQLSRFGALLNVPAYTCSDLSTLTSLIQSLDDQDLILVDTPGASPSDLARLAKLEEVLKLPEARVNLVIGATTRSVDIDHILTRFKGFAPQRLILTKIDETDSRSAVVGDLLRNEVGITFLTNGQRVPEDLLIPSASEMARWVLPVD
ncbi:MAG TPA: flagellar biosynthesis protein FlhF [Terriglobia bacterium]|nr:flagellar biosynthesis protein FlhF [Terriglobia bacterium]